jgi:hypothetical protein
LADVRFVPKADKVQRSKKYLLDHLVGADNDRVGHGEAERFRRLEIDGQLELGRLLDRQIGRSAGLEPLMILST